MLQTENSKAQTDAAPKAENVVGGAVDAAKDVSEKAKEMSGKAVEGVKNVTEEAKKVTDAGAKAAGQVAAAGGQVVGQVGEVAGEMKKMGAAVVGQVKTKELVPNLKSDEKMYATVAYLPFVSVITLMLKPDSDFVKKHSKQGLALVLVFFVSIIITAILGSFPVIGLLLAFLFGLLPTACMFIGIYMMMLAFTGYWWKIPVIGAIAGAIPTDFLTAAMKTGVPGQVEVAKVDYDERKDAVKEEKKDLVTDVNKVDVKTEEVKK